MSSLLVFTVDGPESSSLSVLGDGVIGMQNVLGVISSVLRLPSSCDCTVKLISESVSRVTLWFSCVDFLDMRVRSGGSSSGFCLFLICVSVWCCIGSCDGNRVDVMWCGAFSMSALAVCVVSSWAIRTSASCSWCAAVPARWSAAMSRSSVVVSALSVTVVLSSAKCCKMTYCIAFVASLSCCWAVVPLVGISTSITVVLGSYGILVYWSLCCWGSCQCCQFCMSLLLSFSNCSHLCSNNLQWCKSVLYVSCMAGSCKCIQSQASWYFLACCSNIILMVSIVCWCSNLQLFTSDVILVFNACTCSSGCCLMSLMTSSLWCQ